MFSQATSKQYNEIVITNKNHIRGLYRNYTPGITSRNGTHRLLPVHAITKTLNKLP